MLTSMVTSILRWQESKERECANMIAAIFSSLYLGEGPLFILPGYGSESPSDSLVETESLQLGIERTETELDCSVTGGAFGMQTQVDKSSWWLHRERGRGRDTGYPHVLHLTM